MPANTPSTSAISASKAGLSAEAMAAHDRPACFLPFPQRPCRCAMLRAIAVDAISARRRRRSWRIVILIAMRHRQNATLSPPLRPACRAPRSASRPPATALRERLRMRRTWSALDFASSPRPVIQAVLQPDTDVAAHGRRHGDHRHLVPARGQHRESVICRRTACRRCASCG